MKRVPKWLVSIACVLFCLLVACSGDGKLPDGSILEPPVGTGGADDSADSDGGDGGTDEVHWQETGEARDVWFQPVAVEPLDVLSAGELGDDAGQSDAELTVRLAPDHEQVRIGLQVVGGTVGGTFRTVEGWIVGADGARYLLGVVSRIGPGDVEVFAADWTDDGIDELIVVGGVGVGAIEAKVLQRQEDGSWHRLLTAPRPIPQPDGAGGTVLVSSVTSPASGDVWLYRYTGEAFERLDTAAVLGAHRVNWRRAADGVALEVWHRTDEVQPEPTDDAHWREPDARYIYRAGKLYEAAETTE